MAGPRNKVLIGSTSRLLTITNCMEGREITMYGIGSTLMVGSKVDNDQFYGGTGHGVMIGGRDATTLTVT